MHYFLTAPQVNALVSSLSVLSFVVDKFQQNKGTPFSANNPELLWQNQLNRHYAQLGKKVSESE
jgi:hypothetical protein